MSYQVSFSHQALKQLKKMDKRTSGYILAWIKKNLVDSTNPQVKGKPLRYNKKGLWRYRVGDFRIITEIHDEELIILVLNVGHRKSIYERNK
ncbi:TPA_asm: type II toxin-antitoxin system mRNA interferase toxin, RelE/StbE family [Listeria monocytogenes]|nr:type II toxin-antitoxin system mRNA interferase toxin, RelE/StbE family [Listeria monocytogenes]HAC0982504.1 type II toxin-antitoxin system mRNA interferase toxin, RelE/StbE family [Listeria monocytogenes]